MSSVSNQLPYIELKPLPVQQDRCPRLQKLIARVCLAVPIIGFSTSFGLAAGLAEWGFSIMTGAIIGSVIGVIISIAVMIFIPHPSKVCQYRLDSLGQIEKTLANGQALQGIKVLRKFFTSSLERFEFPYSSHRIHSALTAVTTKIEKDRPDIKAFWTAFLKHLDGIKMKNPDGAQLTLDFSMDFERLEGKELLLEVPPFRKGWFGFDEKAIAQIEKIQQVSFGKDEALSKEEIKKRIANETCVIVRRRGTSEILGYCLFHEDRSGVQIDQIARKPNASHLSIGSTLLYTVLKQQDEGIPVRLKLRTKNPARTLLTQWGFVPKQELKGAYQKHPPEDGVLMQLDWKKYQECVSKLP